MQYPTELVGFSCWRLWKARNYAVFGDRNWIVGQILEQAPHQYDDYVKSLGLSGSENIKILTHTKVISLLGSLLR
jgi:hypothetical protein